MGDSVFTPDDGLPTVTDRERLEHVDNASIDARVSNIERSELYTPVEELWGSMPVPAHVMRERNAAAECLSNAARQLGEALKQAQRARQHADGGDLGTAHTRMIDAVDDCTVAALASVQTAMGMLSRFGDA